MSDVSFAKAVWWRQWGFLAAVSVAHFWPRIVAAGRLRQLEDRSAGLDVAMEQLLKARYELDQLKGRGLPLPGAGLGLAKDGE